MMDRKGHQFYVKRKCERCPATFTQKYYQGRKLCNRCAAEARRIGKIIAQAERDCPQLLDKPEGEIGGDDTVADVLSEDAPSSGKALRTLKVSGSVSSLYPPEQRHKALESDRNPKGTEHVQSVIESVNAGFEDAGPDTAAQKRSGRKTRKSRKRYNRKEPKP